MNILTGLIRFNGGEIFIKGKDFFKKQAGAGKINWLSA